MGKCKNKTVYAKTWSHNGKYAKINSKYQLLTYIYKENGVERFEILRRKSRIHAFTAAWLSYVILHNRLSLFTLEAI